MIIAASDFGGTFIAELFGFLLVIIFIWRKIAPPLNARMNSRLDQIRGQLAAGDEARAAAQRLVEKRRQELEAARQEASTIVEQSRSSAEQLVADGRRRGEEERERLAARAHVEVELARARAREEVTARVADLVVAAAEAVVEAELDDSLHHHLIADAIAAAESEAN